MTDRPQPAPLTCDDVRELAGAFVLGALEPADEAAVRDHLATCTDAHLEIAEAGSVLPVLDASVPQVEPPAALKTRVMAAAAADLEARRTAGTATATTASTPAPVAVDGRPPARTDEPATATPPADDRPAPIPLPVVARRRTSTATWVLRIAAVLVIGILAGWNLLLQGQLNEADQYRQDVAAVLDVAGQPGSLTAVLTSEGGHGPAGLAAVSAAGDLSLAVRALTPTSGTQVYEAWVIGADGTPVPLGSFPVGDAGTAAFQAGGLPAQDGIVLGLTLEPGPGATTPTLPMVASGTASRAG